MDIVIDLETLGVRPGCSVLSIGASSFDLRDTFYGKASRASNLSAGLKEDAATLAWWDKQSLEARAEAFSGTQDLVLLLGQFHDWFTRTQNVHGEIFVWGNGADFDLPILEAAYTAVGMKKPWKPFNGRCYRTLKNQWFMVEPPPRENAHNALADAKFQAAHALQIMSFRKKLLAPLGYVR